MMSVSVTRSPAEGRYQNLRSERSHYRHDVGQHGVARPVHQSFRGGLGKAEVERAREILVRAVDAPRRQQFIRADDAERFAELVSNEVLAAVPAVERKVGGLDVS